MGKFAELDIDTANGVMISQFFAGLDLRAELPALRALVESWRPDVIVRESWEFGSTLVAELHRIPIVRVGLGLAEMEELSIELAAPEVDKARAELGLPSDPGGERLADAPFLTIDPGGAGRSGRPRRRPAQAAFASRWGRAPRAAGLVAGQRRIPLVYLTFGSVAAGAHLPYYPALYRSAIEALAPLPVRLLVTVGDAAREIEELGEVPSNVHVETWVSHDDVARRADVIVCHGGFGSTLGALAHGTPLVVLPLFSSDQWANGEAVARAGAGIAVADDRTTRNVLELPAAETLRELAGAVTSVLDDGAFRREAGRVAGAMLALPHVDDSVRLLEEMTA